MMALATTNVSNQLKMFFFCGLIVHKPRHTFRTNVIWFVYFRRDIHFCIDLWGGWWAQDFSKFYVINLQTKINFFF